MEIKAVWLKSPSFELASATQNIYMSILARLRTQHGVRSRILKWDIVYELRCVKKMAHQMALATARLPEKLITDERDQAGAWRAWKDELEMYFMASEEADVGDEKKLQS